MTRHVRGALACTLLAATTLCGSCGGQRVSPANPASPSAPDPSALPSTISAAAAFALAQDNKSNANFVILDVRTAGEFATGHIAAAANVDYYSPDFHATIAGLDTGKRYLVYCQSGARGAATTQLMADAAFNRVQNLAGGLDEWLQDGYPIVTPPVALPLAPAITTLEAFALVQSNRTNAAFVILDVRTPAEFATGHIAGALNIDYYSPNFSSRISALAAGSRYLVYCRTGVRGAASAQIMAGMGFAFVQNLTGGLDQWMKDGYPTVL